MTSYDTRVFDALGKADAEQKAGSEQLLRMSFEAERMGRDVAEDPESRVGLIDRARSAASFLKPFYKTRGKRERQQNLFPELETEIAAERAT